MYFCLDTQPENSNLKRTLTYVYEESEYSLSEYSLPDSVSESPPRAFLGGVNLFKGLFLSSTMKRK